MIPQDPAETAEGAPARPGSPTILILEDDPLAREFLANELSSDYRVLPASSVSEAEGHLFAGEEEPEVDLVIMDYMLEEGVTAFQAMDYLQSKGMDLPVIMITAQGDEETAVAALKRGFSDYLAKRRTNLNRDLLRSKIEAALAVHRLRRENDRLSDMIEDSQQRLFSVYDSLDDVIMQIDRDCRICSVNRAGAAYADSEPKEIVGKVCWEVFDFYPCDRRRRKDQCHIYQTFLEGETIEGERKGEESGRTYQFMTFITTHRGGEYVVYRETDVTAQRGVESKLDEALRAILRPPEPRRRRSRGNAKKKTTEGGNGEES